METKSIMENHVRQRHLEMAFICRLCETGNIHYEPDLPSIKDHLKEDHSKDDLDNEDVKDYTRYPRLVQSFYTPTDGQLTSKGLFGVFKSTKKPHFFTICVWRNTCINTM